MEDKLANKNFVLCLVFSHDMKDTLLLLRNKNPHKNQFNSVGGKIEAGESPYQAAKREFTEETGISIDAFTHMQYITKETFSNNAEMDVFYFRLHEYNYKEIKWELDEGRLMWHPVKHCLTYSKIYAGEGNLQYFITKALIMEGIEV